MTDRMPPAPAHVPASDLLDFQRDLARALLAATPQALPGLEPARLGLHRRTVTLSLLDNLRLAFPVAARLLGRDFDRLAIGFLRRHPPDRPQLPAYGAGFPAALADEFPLAADVARLEWAFLESFFAADATPLNGGDFADIAADDYPRLSLRPHPATRLIQVAAPVTALWRLARADEAAPRLPHPADPAPPDRSVLLTRPWGEVMVEDLPAGGGALLGALMTGARLEEAAQAAMDAAPTADLQGLLVLLLRQGALSGVDREETGSGVSRGEE